MACRWFLVWIVVVQVALAHNSLGQPTGPASRQNIYHQALREARARQDRLVQGQLFVKLRLWDSAQKAFDNVLHLNNESNAALSQAHLGLAQVTSAMGDLDSAQAILGRAVRIARLGGDSVQLARLLTYAAATSLEQGLPLRAQQQCRQALPLFYQADSLRAAEPLAILAQVERRLDLLAEAQTHALLADRFALTLKKDSVRALVYKTLGEVYRLQHRDAEASKATAYYAIVQDRIFHAALQEEADIQYARAQMEMPMTNEAATRVRLKEEPTPPLPWPWISLGLAVLALAGLGYGIAKDSRSKKTDRQDSSLSEKEALATKVDLSTLQAFLLQKLGSIRLNLAARSEESSPFSDLEEGLAEVSAKIKELA